MPKIKVSKAPGCIQAATVLLGHWGINASNLTLLKSMTKLPLTRRVKEQTAKGTDVAWVSQLYCALLSWRGTVHHPGNTRGCLLERSSAAGRDQRHFEFLRWRAKAVAVVTDHKWVQRENVSTCLLWADLCLLLCQPITSTGLLNAQDAQRVGWEQPCGVKVTAIRRKHFVTSGSGARFCGGCKTVAGKS